MKCGMLNLSIFLILTLHLLHAVHGLYFHIAETERKCFIEEIPDETNVIGRQYLQVQPQKNYFNFLFSLLQSITK